MSFIGIYNPTSRRTNCHEIHLFGVNVLFSYETPVAFSAYLGDDKPRRARRRNEWGPTTGRHINEAGMSGHPQMEEQEFNQLLQQTLVDAVLHQVSNRMEGKPIY